MTQPIAASTIVQQAFRALELSAPSSFADDSPQANDAAEQYPEALRQCLEMADWSFASELASLPEAIPGTDVVTDPDLPHAFVLPGDVVAIRQIHETLAKWRTDRRFLRADIAGPLTIRYTAQITDEAQLPASFRLTVALRLAVLLGARWLSAQGKRDRLQRDAEIAMREALRFDARYASHRRWDGRPGGGDWASEALL